MEERNDLDFIIENPRQHLCLTIIDIMGLMKDAKLGHLKDDVAYSVILSYNNGLLDEFHINSEMNGLEIRKMFDTLPNDKKIFLKKKVIIYDIEAREFLENLFEYCEVQHRLYIKDVGAGAGIINLIALVVLIVSIMLYVIYKSNTIYRGDVGETHGDAMMGFLFDYLATFWN